MKSNSSVFLALALLCLSFVSSAQEPAVDASVLNGNWHLTGALNAKQQIIDLTLGVEGNTIYAEGQITLFCVDGQASNTKINLLLEGQVASDGGFVLSNRYPLSEIPAQKAFLRGRVPTSGAGEWSGRFDILPFSKTGNQANECPAVSHDYVATQFPPLSGVYEGPVRITGADNGETEATVSLEVSQGNLIPNGSSRLLGHPILVDATITVSGSSVFPAGPLKTGITPGNNRMFGNGFETEFLHERGGNQFTVTGRFTPPEESRIRVTLIYSPKNEDGKSNIVTATGWLTRQ